MMPIGQGLWDKVQKQWQVPHSQPFRIVAIPLAATVLMSVSTIVVAINAQLMRKTAF